MKGAYDNGFYEWLNLTAQPSAHILLPIVIRHLHPQSVLDVGCGRGAWLAEWSKLGLVDWLGADGGYVDRGSLQIPSDRVVAVGLGHDRTGGRRFDFVQSLHVAAH